MEFVLLKKLAKLEGTELWMFIGAIVAVAALIAVLAVLNKKHVNAAPTVEKKGKKLTTRMLVQGALCIALAFVLSYIKLFSMPMGGSITLFSMLPIFVFAWMYGPAAGLLAGFAYSLLQVVQGAYVVHPVQFVLDYFLSFTVLGLAGFFPKSLALGAGKTKRIIDIANETLKTANGSIVFIDNDSQYMFGLKHDIRFVDASEYHIDSPKMFFGFVSGIAAQDFDLEYLFVDGFMKIHLKYINTFYMFFSGPNYGILQK